jgi:hypothetical protein
MKARFRQHPAVLSRVLPDGVLLERGEEMKELTGPAVVAWGLLDAPRTVPDLSSLLAEVYQVPDRSIRAVVENLVDTLVAEEMAEEVVDGDT